MTAPLGSTHRRIAIAIDLSDESTYTVRSAVTNYLWFLIAISMGALASEKLILPSEKQPYGFELGENKSP
ncbi:hypothetical protein GUJ93_ZPchr0008g13548 [Zizania palustris]|uniref:Uncharacterized protein n=1 Tax=Zizania palustris TaxID=103762 RepID=A0A8J5RYT5_ZIZPA|nr:hypothetical protein GUJ93_ZPchr0008g13548 [Zizania palustris]